MSRRGLTLALIAAALFGVSGVVAADVFSHIPPMEVARIRSVIGAMALAPVAWRRRQGPLPLGRLFAFGATIAAVATSFYVAIDRLGVGPGVTIQFLGPILVLVWMARAQARPVSRRSWWAALIAVAGTALITEIWHGSRLDTVGVVAALAAAVTFAAYLIQGEALGRRIPPTVVMTIGFATSAVILTILHPTVPAVPTPGTGVALLWIGIGGTAVPFLLEVEALKLADPGRIGVVATAEPVIAAAAAWLALGQRLTLAQVIGGALVIAAVAWVQLEARAAAHIPPDVV